MNTGLDLRKILDKNDKIRWNQVDEFFKERKRLGYQGKIYVEPVKYKEIVLNDSVLNPLLTRIGKSEIKFSEVTAIIVGLLPFELKINLKYFTYKDGEQYEALGEVKIIRDLVFFLRDGGMRSVDSYRIDFSDSENCFLNYCAGCCILHHIDNIVLDLFVEASEFLIINKG